MFKPFRFRGGKDALEKFNNQEIDKEKLKNLELEKSDTLAMTLAFFQVVFPALMAVVVLFGLGIWLFTKLIF